MQLNNKIQRMRTEMNNCIYDQFQLEDQFKRDQNLSIERIEGTKKKSKIKRIRTEIKTYLDNQF